MPASSLVGWLCRYLVKPFVLLANVLLVLAENQTRVRFALMKKDRRAAVAARRCTSVVVIHLDTRSEVHEGRWHEHSRASFRSHAVLAVAGVTLEHLCGPVSAYVPTHPEELCRVSFRGS